MTLQEREDRETIIRLWRQAFNLDHRHNPVGSNRDWTFWKLLLEETRKVLPT